MGNLFLGFSDRVKEEEFIKEFDYQHRVFNRIGILLSTFAWLALLLYSFFAWPHVFTPLAYIYSSKKPVKQKTPTLIISSWITFNPS